MIFEVNAARRGNPDRSRMGRVAGNCSQSCRTDVNAIASRVLPQERRREGAPDDVAMAYDEDGAGTLQRVGNVRRILAHVIHFAPRPSMVPGASRAATANPDQPAGQLPGKTWRAHVATTQVRLAAIGGGERLVYAEERLAAGFMRKVLGDRSSRCSPECRSRPRRRRQF